MGQKISFNNHPYHVFILNSSFCYKEYSKRGGQLALTTLVELPSPGSFLGMSKEWSSDERTIPLGFWVALLWEVKTRRSIFLRLDVENDRLLGQENNDIFANRAMPMPSKDTLKFLLRRAWWNTTTTPLHNVLFRNRGYALIHRPVLNFFLN